MHHRTNTGCAGVLLTVSGTFCFQGFTSSTASSGLAYKNPGRAPRNALRLRCARLMWLMPVLRRPSLWFVPQMPIQRESRLPLCHTLQGSLLQELSTAVDQSPCRSVPRGVSLLLVSRSVCPLSSRPSSAGAPCPNCSRPFPPPNGFP